MRYILGCKKSSGFFLFFFKCSTIYIFVLSFVIFKCSFMTPSFQNLASFWVMNWSKRVLQASIELKFFPFEKIKISDNLKGQMSMSGLVDIPAKLYQFLWGQQRDRRLGVALVVVEMTPFKWTNYFWLTCLLSVQLGTILV